MRSKRIRKYNWLKRLRKHGFRARSKTPGGRRVLIRRLRKGRTRLAVSKK